MTGAVKGMALVRNSAVAARVPWRAAVPSVLRFVMPVTFYASLYHFLQSVRSVLERSSHLHKTPPLQFPWSLAGYVYGAGPERLSQDRMIEFREQGYYRQNPV